VVDKDEPQSGHRFYFTLAPEASSNRHFTLWDVKGKRIIFHALSVSEQCAQAEKAYKEQESAKCALLCMSVGVCMSVLVHTMHK